jgi:hypothetical protein
MFVKIQFLPPLKWKNFSYDDFYSDGKVYILFVK